MLQVREIQVTGGELLTEDLEGPPGQATILGYVYEVSGALFNNVLLLPLIRFPHLQSPGGC